MNIVHFNTNTEIKEKIDSFISKGTLIPILGSGFSKGCRALNGLVPDGNEMQEIMTNEICKVKKELSRNDFLKKKYNFSQIADFFYKFVDRNKINEIVKNNFFNVKLEEYKINFLKVNWPYLYTLNIDDAIEKSSGFNKVLPYKNLSEDVKLTKCVFKLHGDAFHEITYPDEQNIIFSREQYIKSLERNKTMLSLFQSDYSEKNVLFVGCSLDDELDLDYIITTNENLNHAKVLRIFVTDTEPDEFRKIELAKYAVNTVLIIDSPKQFYTFFQELANKSYTVEQTIVEQYKNPSVSFLKGSIDGNKYYLQGGSIRNKNNNYVIPDFAIRRDLTKNILKELNQNLLNLIVGRRCSGKTLFLLSIVNLVRDRDIYFLPSDISLSESEISCLMSKKNSLIIFDSNSLSYVEAEYILKNIDRLKSNKSNILISINSSDRLIFALLSSPDHIGYYDLYNKFSDNEIMQINGKLSSIGLSNIDKNLSIFENIFRFSQIYSHNILNLPSYNSSQVTNNELQLFILLATMDKIYSIVFNVLEIKYSDVENILKKFEPVVQKEYPNFIELHQHSGFKAIANCKGWIYNILSEVLSTSDGMDRIVSCVFNVVEKTIPSPKYSVIYKNLILFDTLNQIFFKKEGGAINLIFQIYERLESLLSHDGHYWLQRAKSILYLKRTDHAALNRSLDYAKKSFYDANRDSKLQNNAIFTIALIYGRLARLSDYLEKHFVDESIKWYYDALQSNQFNKKYIADVISKAQGRKYANDLYSLANHLLLNSKTISDYALLGKAEWIVNALFKK